MCIKIGDDELETVKALMTMSLNAVILDVFDLDLDDLELELSLTKDLGMDAEKQLELAEMIDDMFDGLVIDFNVTDTLEELFEVIIEAEFEEVESV